MCLNEKRVCFPKQKCSEKRGVVWVRKSVPAARPDGRTGDRGLPLRPPPPHGPVGRLGNRPRAERGAGEEAVTSDHLKGLGPQPTRRILQFLPNGFSWAECEVRGPHFLDEVMYAVLEKGAGEKHRTPGARPPPGAPAGGSLTRLPSAVGPGHRVRPARCQAPPLLWPRFPQSPRLVRAGALDSLVPPGGGASTQIPLTHLPLWWGAPPPARLDSRGKSRYAARLHGKDGAP